MDTLNFATCGSFGLRLLAAPLASVIGRQAATVVRAAKAGTPTGTVRRARLLDRVAADRGRARVRSRDFPRFDRSRSLFAKFVTSRAWCCPHSIGRIRLSDAQNGSYFRGARALASSGRRDNMTRAISQKWSFVGSHLLVFIPWSWWLGNRGSWRSVRGAGLR